LLSPHGKKFKNICLKLMKNKNGDKNNIIDNEIGEDIIKNKI
jgi:hypothetical protein